MANPGSGPDIARTAAGPPRHRAAIVLAGGRGRRLGGLDKPSLLVGDRSLLDIALAAVAGSPIVVVGPARSLPAGVTTTREDPPGGGPAAAVVAGLAALPALLAPAGEWPAARPGPGGTGVEGLPASTDESLVVVLAADLPNIDPAAIRALCDVVAGGPAAGALLLDGQGRRQYLAGAWRIADLRRSAGRHDDWHGRSARDLFAPIATVEVPGYEYATTDVDTVDDWRRLGPT